MRTRQLPAQQPPNRTAEGHARGLPSVGAGIIRTRWTRYNVDIPTAGVQVPVNLNCWRATIIFPVTLAPTWDGIDMKKLLNSAVGYDVVQVVIGGAMFDGRPVYLNETHYLTDPTGIRPECLVIEEYFDGAARPNN